MGDLLSGRTIAVVGTGNPLGDGLAAAIAAAGARTVLHDGTAFDGPIEGLGGTELVHGVVHVAPAISAYERTPFHEVDDEHWDRVWEHTLVGTIRVLQAGFRAMRDRGGAFVIVTPVIGMAGEAELAPYAAAVEGVRILAKSAARQWGPDGIRVNCLAPAPEHVPIGVASSALALSPPALGGPGDAEGDLGPIAAWLLSDGAHFLTGATLCADGGVWMAP